MKFKRPTFFAGGPTLRSRGNPEAAKALKQERAEKAEKGELVLGDEAEDKIANANVRKHGYHFVKVGRGAFIVRDDKYNTLGISWSDESKKWSANIVHEGRMKDFNSLEEALDAHRQSVTAAENIANSGAYVDQIEKARQREWERSGQDVDDSANEQRKIA